MSALHSIAMLAASVADPPPPSDPRLTMTAEWCRRAAGLLDGAARGLHDPRYPLEPIELAVRDIEGALAVLRQMMERRT